jgi:hypothetical protein
MGERPKLVDDRVPLPRVNPQRHVRESTPRPRRPSNNYLGVDSASVLVPATQEGSKRDIADIGGWRSEWASPRPIPGRTRSRRHPPTLDSPADLRLGALRGQRQPPTASPGPEPAAWPNAGAFDWPVRQGVTGTSTSKAPQRPRGPLAPSTRGVRQYAPDRAGEAFEIAEPIASQARATAEPAPDLGRVVSARSDDERVVGRTGAPPSRSGHEPHGKEARATASSQTPPPASPKRRRTLGQNARLVATIGIELVSSSCFACSEGDLTGRQHQLNPRSAT